MKFVIKKANVWGGVSSSAEKGYSLSSTRRLCIAATYKASDVGNELPIACVKKAAFKGEIAQPPPTCKVTLHCLRFPTDWLRKKISTWP